MQARARLVPPLVGLLALGCQLAAVGAGWIELHTDSQRQNWSVRLWVSGAIAALAALVLGLAVDGRGLTIPLALLFLAAFPVGAFLFFATRDW